MTVVIVSVSIAIPTLVWLALLIAKKEDDEIADLKHRIEELEQGKKKN